MSRKAGPSLPREVLGALGIRSRLRTPAHPWTVWIDEMAAPLHKVQHRQDAERILLDYADHDYMYIESPAGEQYAWNHFRRCWERVG
jgi:hypothetical protein